MQYPPPGSYAQIHNHGYGNAGHGQSTDSFMAVPDEKYMQSSFEPEARQARGWSKKRWIITIGCIIGVIAIAAGVAGGVVAAQNSKKHSSSSQSDKTTSTSGSNASDSNFAKNPNLHMSFPGLCYSPPYSSFYPNCGDTIEGVVQDIQLMSQLTTVVRLYGSDCNTSSLVLDAIERTGVNMTAYLAIYFDTDTTVFTRQLSEVISVLQQYGTDHVDGLIVGNEYILSAFNNAASPSAAARAQSAAEKVVIQNIATTRAAVKALNLPKDLPIGTGDAGSMITATLAEAADFIMANVHPFFSGVNIDDAAGWTWDYINTDTPSIALTVANKPTLFNGEVGWPSDAAPNGSLTLNGSAATIENMQTFLNDYVCQSNQNQSKYFAFEFADETWKNAAYGGAESHWGLFTADRQLKNITIPNCEVDFFMGVEQS